ncbi:MAG: class I SAM-dependent methyltransferase [Thermincolia bacterium]
MNNEIKSYYDLTAERTADAWYKEEILKPTIQDFVVLLPKEPRILDLGCGTGHETMRLSLTGAKVVGIDFSEECIKVARERCPQCRFEVMDFRFPDKELGKFDGVFACASLIHIAPDELRAVIKNIKDVLTDDGFVAMIVQDGEGIREDWSLLDVDGQNLERTVYRYTEEQLVSVTQEVGLQFVRTGYLEKSLLEYGWRNYIFKM